MKKLFLTLSFGLLFFALKANSPFETIRNYVISSEEKIDAFELASHVNESLLGNTTFGTPNVFNTGQTLQTFVAALSSTHFVIAYQDEAGTANAHGSAIVGSINGTTITYGTEVSFNADHTTNISISALSSSQVVIAYADETNINHGTAIIGTVSGNAISFGTEKEFNGAGTGEISVSAMSSSKFVVGYCDDGNSNLGTVIIGTVSGSSITFGSEFLIYNTVDPDFGISVAGLSSTHFVVAFSDLNNNGFQGYARVGSVNGTNVSFGAPKEFNSGFTGAKSVAAISSSSFIIGFSDSSSGFSIGTAIVGSVSGVTISLGLKKVFKNSNTNTIYVSTLSVSEVIITFRDHVNSGYGTAIVGTVTGNSVNFDTEKIFNAASTQSGSVSSLTSDLFVVAYRDGNNNDEGTAIIGNANDSYTVTKTADTDDGICDTDCSLREALSEANANADDDIIEIPAGTYSLETVADQLEITDAVIIKRDDGGGDVIIEAHSTRGSATDRVFEVSTTDAVTFENLTIRHGNTNSSNNGAGLRIASGSNVTLNSVIITQNDSGLGGGGIYTTGSGTNLYLDKCTVSQNTASGFGGGILDNGTDGANLSLTDTKIHGNISTDKGGGLYLNASGTNADFNRTSITNNSITGDDSADDGGGLYLSAGSATFTFTNCTIGNNSARDGGGLYDAGSSNIINLVNCTVAENSALFNGGGIRFANSSGQNNLINTIVADNTGGGVGNDIQFASGTMTNASEADHSIVEFCTGSCPSSPAFITTNPNLIGQGGCISQNPTGVITYPFNAGSSADSDVNPGTPTGAPSVDVCSTPRNNPPDIGSFELGSVLPVEILKINVEETIMGDVNLKWEVQYENQNEGFEIEHSTYQNNWSVLGFIKGKNKGFEVSEYNFLHKKPKSGIHFYRLKQIDFDGSFEYSKVVSLDLRVENQIQIYPNPTNGHLEIKGDNLDNAQIQISDNTGKVIRTEMLNQSSVDISDLPNGIYFLRVTNDNQIFEQKIIKK